MKTKSFISLVIIASLITVTCSKDSPTIPKEEKTPTNNFWIEKKALPIAIGTHTAVVNNMIYALGGPTKCEQADDNRTIYRYDPEADTWIDIGERPTERFGFRSCAVNGKIYVMGGAPTWYDVALDLVQEYDPMTGSWTNKSPMKRGKMLFSTCTANGKIYVIGGITACLRYGCCLSSIDEYDPATDTWTTITSMSIPRHGQTSCVLNGKIYVIGGQTPFGIQGYSVDLDSVNAYDLETGNWTSVASLPDSVYGLSSSVVDGKIFVVGGADKFTQNFMYDPDTDTWIPKAEIKIGRYYHYTEVIDKKIYAISGFDCAGRALASVAAYAP